MTLYRSRLFDSLSPLSPHIDDIFDIFNTPITMRLARIEESAQSMSHLALSLYVVALAPHIDIICELRNFRHGELGGIRGYGLHTKDGPFHFHHTLMIC